MKEFVIDIAWCCSVNQITYHSLLKDKLNPTPEDLVKILKGEAMMTEYQSVDHPMFALLRKELAERGFIDMVTNSWNGDTVTKPFKLNDVVFKTGARFPCAAAIKYDLEHPTYEYK